MEHAAKTTRGVPCGHLGACISLKRGSSAQASWVLEDVPGGSLVRVGTAERCDWPIHADGVPPYALSILLLSGNIFVSGTAEGSALLNGSVLDDTWTLARSGARIDIGLARLEITARAERPVLGAAPYILTSESGTFLPVRVTTKPESSSSAATRTGLRARSEPCLEGARANAYVRATLDVLPDEEAFVESPLPTRMPTSEFTASLLGEGSVLGEGPRASSGPWLYVVAALVTLSAYAGWVVALDR